jgi:hypothetical protein
MLPIPTYFPQGVGFVKRFGEFFRISGSGVIPAAEIVDEPAFG